MDNQYCEMQCVYCKKPVLLEINSPEHVGIFNVFCRDNNGLCEDNFAFPEPNREKRRKMTEKLTGLDFFGALRIAAATDRRIRYKTFNNKLPRQIIGGWADYTTDQTGKAFLLSKEKNYWWPSFDQQKEEVWEVEPEKQEEAFVWGIYGEDGNFQVHLAPGMNSKKYRPVPADQPLWPWKKFVKNEMPKKEFEFLALMSSGKILTDRWCLYDSGWGSLLLNEDHIECYCRISEIPTPGLCSE